MNTNTGWTKVRLDALPDHTVVLSGPGQEPLRRDRELAGEDGWCDPEGRNVFSDEIATIGSIRVVSVPVEELLSEATERAVYERTMWGSETIPEIVRAAIAHVTGEVS